MQKHPDSKDHLQKVPFYSLLKNKDIKKDSSISCFQLNEKLNFRLNLLLAIFKFVILLQIKTMTKSLFFHINTCAIGFLSSYLHNDFSLKVSKGFI
jgi:hypothetical protein